MYSSCICFIVLLQCCTNVYFVKYFVAVAIETVKMLISFGVSSFSIHSLLHILSSYTPMYLDIFLDNLTNIR